MNDKKISLDITFLFPNTMSTYGDSGNVLALQKRCEWRNIEVKIHYSDIYDSIYPSDISLFKNIIACYQHGPLLPKNPHLADYIISKAIENRYGLGIKINEIDNTLEYAAYNSRLKKLKI